MSYRNGKRKQVDTCNSTENDAHGHSDVSASLYLAHSTHLSSGKAPSSASRTRTITSQSNASSSDSGLSTEPSPTIPQLSSSPTPGNGVGLGRPSTSRFDSLQDLLQQAGYKETRIVTPKTHTSFAHTSPRNQSAAQQALALNILSDSQIQQQLQASSSSAATSESTANNSGWFSSLLIRPRRTISTSILRDQHEHGIPHSSSDPTISSNIPTLVIDPCSPTLVDSPLQEDRPTLDASQLGPIHSLRPALRKRASRTSHALWTGSMAYRSSHTLNPNLRLHQHHPKRSATVSGPTPSNSHNRPRPSLQAAFAASPTKSTKGSTTVADSVGSPAENAGELGDVRTRRAEFEAQYDLHRKVNQSPPSSPKEEEEAVVSKFEHKPTRKKSTRLMANPALPILSAAPAVALRHEACLIPSSIALITDARASDPFIVPDSNVEGADSEEAQNGVPTQSTRPVRRPGLGRMRSVDLLRDALDAMLRIRENAADASQTLAAVDEVGFAGVSSEDDDAPPDSHEGRGGTTTSSSGTLLSVSNSMGLSGETGITAEPLSITTVPMLFLSSPRGITGPQPIAFESILDPPTDVEEGVENAPGGAPFGLGFGFFSLFGRGKNKSNDAVPPSAPPSSPSPAPPSIIIGGAANGMINSASIEAELDRILAGGATSPFASSPTRPRKRRERPASSSTNYQDQLMERRSSTDSLEVIKPLRIRRKRGSRSSSSSSVSSAGSASEGGTNRSMTPSQLDRIESALRGSAGTLSGARKVSALRSDVEGSRAGRDGGAGDNTGGAVASGRSTPTDLSSEDGDLTVRKVLEEENPFLVDSNTVAALLSEQSPESERTMTTNTTAKTETTDSSSASSSSGTSATTASTHTASEVAVRKFLESLVELETPGRSFSALPTLEDEEVLGRMSLDGSSACSKEPVGSSILAERPAHANADSGFQLGRSSSNSPPNLNITSTKASPSDETKQGKATSELGPSAVISDTHRQLSKRSHSDKPHGRRKTILAITHNDVRRRPSSLSSHPSSGMGAHTPNSARTSSSSSSSSMPVSDLLDSQGRLRKHVVLVSDENYLGESPTSAMLAQRQRQQQHQRVSSLGAGKVLRSTSSQPVMGKSAVVG
ncbi:hypothetical protein A4X13_0g1184 [Tilletia indica]|uniref:Uncharacterized protein n=1 Tax=Tilletia indica TaxID=43049 RepID=A0A177TSY3_9BASI|nr:hypothetical protein A4X13_0g1184 [Tilletia indica]